MDQNGPQEDAQRPISSTRVWSEEAIRIVIRYNYERGLTVRQCLDEMELHIAHENMKEESKLMRIYRLYRDLGHGVYNYVGNYTKPENSPIIQVMEKFRAQLRARCAQMQNMSETEDDEESSDEEMRSEDNDADESESDDA